MKARDAWIGWGEQERQQNLQRIVNNGRFLILPWVQVHGFGEYDSLPLCPSSCRTTGRRNMAIGRCCWRRLWMPSVSRVPAIALPTGFTWAKRRAVDAWTGTRSASNP